MKSGRDIRYNKEDSELLFKSYMDENKTSKDMLDYIDLVEWVESGNIKDLLNQVRGVKDSNNTLTYVDLHYTDGDESQQQKQQEYPNKIVGRVEVDGYETLSIDLYANLRGFIGEYENDDYLIRVMSLKDKNDSIIYVIKKAYNLGDIKVLVNRIPNSGLMNKRVMFLDSDDSIGLKVNISEIK